MTLRVRGALLRAPHGLEAVGDALVRVDALDVRTDAVMVVESAAPVGALRRRTAPAEGLFTAHAEGVEQTRRASRLAETIVVDPLRGKLWAVTLQHAFAHMLQQEDPT